jgi:uncharacterized protein
MIKNNLSGTEFHGKAIVATTGRCYQQNYATRMEIKDGKIVGLRDYFNPTAVIAAFGDTRNSRVE